MCFLLLRVSVLREHGGQHSYGMAYSKYESYRYIRPKQQASEPTSSTIARGEGVGRSLFVIGAVLAPGAAVELGPRVVPGAMVLIVITLADGARLVPGEGVTGAALARCSTIVLGPGVASGSEGAPGATVGSSLVRSGAHVSPGDRVVPGAMVLIGTKVAVGARLSPGELGPRVASGEDVVPGAPVGAPCGGFEAHISPGDRVLPGAMVSIGTEVAAGERVVVSGE